MFVLAAVHEAYSLAAQDPMHVTPVATSSTKISCPAPPFPGTPVVACELMVVEPVMVI